MAISNCKHHYLIETPNGSWALAICKKCKMKTAFRNSIDWDIHKRVLSSDQQTKFEFLESMNIPIKDLIPTDKKEWVLPYVQEFGIQGTARKFGIPTSTVGMWAKGKSGMPRNADKYSPSVRKKVMERIENNISQIKIAKEFNIPRTTVQSWANSAKNGLKSPHLNDPNDTNSPLNT